MISMATSIKNGIPPGIDRELFALFNEGSLVLFDSFGAAL